MNSIVKWFVIIQSGAAFAIVFLLRFFDYIVENEVTVMFKPLVFIAILVTVILSLIISAAYLFAHKAKNGSLIPIWINLCTILLLFLPLREWGIKYNFNKYYEQRNNIVSEYCKEEIDKETIYLTPKEEGEFAEVTSSNSIIVFEQDGKLAFYFSLYNGLLGTSEGFMCITDVAFQSTDTIRGVEQYYEMDENWYFGVIYNK